MLFAKERELWYNIRTETSTWRIIMIVRGIWCATAVLEGVNATISFKEGNFILAGIWGLAAIFAILAAIFHKEK